MKHFKRHSVEIAKYAFWRSPRPVQAIFDIANYCVQYLVSHRQHPFRSICWGSIYMVCLYSVLFGFIGQKKDR